MFGMKFFREVILPAGLLGSLIVGAGMFSLPYVFAQAGFVFGIALLAFFSLVAAVIHIKYASLVSAGGPDKRFVALSERYLGKKWRLPATVVIVGGIIITLSVYLSLSASFTRLIVPQITDSAAVFLFWFVGSLFIALGILKYAFLDFLIFIAIAGIIAFIGVTGYFFGRSGEIFPGGFSISSGLIAFGPLLFSLSGRSAISAIWEEHHFRGGQRANFLRAVVIGTLIPALLYLVFVYGVGKLSSFGVSADAVSGITLLGSSAGVLIGVLGLAALITSYVFLGFELKGVLEKDFNLPMVAAFSVPAVSPILIYVFGWQDFFMLVSLAGGFFLAAESLLVVLMYRMATGRKSILDSILAATFIIAIVFEIFTVFR